MSAARLAPLGWFRKQQYRLRAIGLAIVQVDEALHRMGTEVHLLLTLAPPIRNPELAERGPGLDFRHLRPPHRAYPVSCGLFYATTSDVDRVPRMVGDRHDRASLL